jgi:soluble lytic murein transglycosylase
LLEPGRTRLDIRPPRQPTAEEADRFNAREAVRALVIARKAGVDQSVTRVFLTHLRNTLTSEPEQALLAHLAEALGDTQMAVRIGKSAIARGMNLITYAYPVHAMPTYQPLRPAPEPAMLLAVARQESEFNVSTRSGAGARGLLQVMPITAQHVCKDYRLKCEIDRLSTDPAYNAMMASAYIGDRMDEFSGSYLLTIAGYNAGPGRARQWIREFGDPRDPRVDPIDWIHRIPFEETREYVLKVLSNLQIYRARLGDSGAALRLDSDLRRAATPARRTSLAN